MQQPKSIQFKDYIRKLLLTNVIVPVMAIILCTMVLLFGIWYHLSARTNQRELVGVTEQTERILDTYSAFVAATAASITNIDQVAVRGPDSVAIFSELYRIYNELDCRGRLFVFDAVGTQILPESAMSQVNLSFFTNWGIFHLMREDPDAVHLRLHRDRQVFLLLGSAITVGEDIIGYVVISIADEELRSVFPMLASGLVFADSRGYILHAEESVFYDERNRIIPEFAGQTGRVYIHARDYYVSHAHVFGGDLVIYAIYCRTYFRTMLFYTFVPFVAIFFLLSIFLFKSAKKLANKSTARIDKLHDAFVEIQKGQLDSYVSIEGIEEFETIGATFNQTLASLNAQIRRNNEMTETMVAAQIKQLESQFHPHFLFNVLENIRAMCKIDPAVSACMIVELSALLRYSISGVESQVSVSEDLAYTKNYLSLMGKRFNSRFSYKLDVDDDVLHCYIPKLLVQPLIENAIKHGFDRQGKLEVQVEYKRHAGDLIIICKDNGAGIDEETLEQLKRSLQGPQNESEQLGLYNVHRRIQLKYNSNYGLTIESVQHVGTSVTIRLPILNETIE